MYVSIKWVAIAHIPHLKELKGSAEPLRHEEEELNGTDFLQQTATEKGQNKRHKLTRAASRREAHWPKTWPSSQGC
jgi:hypothetical protein